jgi:hypothetical protein
MKPSACFCGTVRNCAPFLERVLANIEILGTQCFQQFCIIIFYDESSDSSLKILLDYQKLYPKHVFIHVNHELLSPYRTWNLANARNFCVQFAFQHFPSYDFLIMMDMDDVNCKNVRPKVLDKYLERNDWDALSFNTMPTYYDTWALSIYPYCFSHNHFERNGEVADEMRRYVTEMLNAMPSNQLLPCISAFNGFCIYRREKIKNCKYDGHFSLTKVPKDYIFTHGEKVKSKIVCKHFGHIDASKEDCEHRLFHISAIQKNQARICISPEKLFVNNF